MRKIIIWFAGFFEDQAGTASSKRAVMYIFTFLMYLLVSNSIELSKIDKKVDLNILLVVGAVILWCIGAVTSEFLSNMGLFKTSTTDTTTTTKTTDKSNAPQT